MADLSLNFAPVAQYTPPQAPAGMANPLAMAGQIMQMQQMQNQNKLFQQEFAAKQAIGQIMSAAPSIDEGLKQVTQSPYSAFAGPAVAAYRGAEQAQSAIALQNTQRQSILMEQYQKGAANVTAALLPAMADPAKMFDKQAAQALSIYPKEMQPTIKGYLDSVKQAVFAGIDPKDPGAQEQLRARLAGKLTGIVPMEQLYGTTVNTDVGTATQISRIPPAWNPDQTLKVIATLPKGRLGTVNQETGLVERSLSPEELANPTGAAPAGAPAGALGPQRPASPAGNALGVPPPVAPAAQAQAPAPASAAGSPYRFAGEKITPDLLGTMIQPSVTGTGLNAYSGEVVPAPTKQQKDQEQKLSEEYTGAGASRAESARQALGQLTIAKTDIDQMIKDGIKPGTGTPMLVELIKAGNRFAELTGSDMKLSETASAEDAMKQLGRLSLSSAKTLINNPQIAAESLQKAIEANPSLSNSELGLKLVLSGVQSDLQRELDKREFLTQWKNDPRNQGLLGNAEESFNKRFPPEKYAETVLKEHGMILKNGELRFASPEALVQAVRDGSLTPDQAKAIRARQFPSGR